MRIAPGDIGERTVLVPVGHIGTIEIGDRALLIDEESGRRYPLSPTASLVWRSLDGSAPLGEIIDDLAEVFATPRHHVAHSVMPLVQDFGLLGRSRHRAPRSLASQGLGVVVHSGQRSEVRAP